MLHIVLGLLFSAFTLVAVRHWGVKKLGVIGAKLGAFVLGADSLRLRRNGGKREGQ